MIESKDITKMVRHIVKHDQGMSNFRIMYPMREWTIGLVVFGLGIIVAGIISVNLFITVSGDQSIPSPIDDVTVPYKAALVTAGLDKYRKLQSQYQTTAQITTKIIPLSSSTITATSTAVVSPTTSKPTLSLVKPIPGRPQRPIMDTIYFELV